MDLGWTQAEWNAFFNKLGVTASSWYAAKRMKEEIGSSRITVDKYLDAADLLVDIELSGLVLGSNTDAEGKLYLVVADPGPTKTVTIYKDSARIGDVMATATVTRADLPTSGILVEDSSSGLSGSIYITADATDADIFLVCTPGLLNQFDVLSPSDEADSSYKANAISNFSFTYRYIDAVITSIETFARNQMIEFIRTKIKSSESVAGGWTESQSGGDVSYESYGIIGDLIDAMDDDTEAGAQTVIIGAASCAVGEDSWVEDVDNVGVVHDNVPTTFTLFEHIIAGDYIIRCVGETKGSETFSVSVITSSGERFIAPYYLRINKTFSSIDLGIEEIKFRWEVTTAGGTEFGAFDDWDFQGLIEDHCDGSKIYLKYTNSTELLELFSDSTRTSDYLIASGTGSEGIVSFTEENSSGLSGSVVVTGVPADDEAMYITIDFFSKDDKIYFTATKVAPSYWNEFFGKLFKVNLPSDTEGGAGTIDYNLANRGFSGLTNVKFD